MLVALSALALACGGGGDGGGGSGNVINFGGGGGGAGGNGGGGGEADADAGPSDVPVEVEIEVTPGAPEVAILGIAGLENSTSLACGGQREVIVAAVNVEGLTLRLLLRDKSKTYYYLDAGAVPDPAIPDQYRFTVNMDNLKAANGGAVGEGESFDLFVGAYAVDPVGTEGEPALPADKTLYDSLTMKFDREPPVISVSEPNINLNPIALMGIQNVSGSATDDAGLASITIAFDGQELATITPDSDKVEKAWDYETTIDLRMLPTDFKPLSIRATDLCGNVSEDFEKDVKVVKWPFLKTIPTFKISGQATANDLEIIGSADEPDWNGDGAPDIFVAMNEGAFIALNDGNGDFSEVIQVSNKPTYAVSALDLDGDNLTDAAIVERGTELQLRVLRQVESGVLVSTETIPFGLSESKAKVVDMIAAEFTGDADGTQRDDIVVATDLDEFALVMFKRQSPDEPQEFDQCQLVEVPLGDSGEMTEEWQCPKLFAEPRYAGGVEDITYIEAADITGDQGPDGFLDVIAGAEKQSGIYTFENRFDEGYIIDTPFSVPNYSPAYPDLNNNAAEVEYFCLGNFIETGEEGDPLDAITGNEVSGTWRIVRGAGDGSFRVKKESIDDPYDPLSMSGTMGEDISGFACADFDQDGHMDFAVTGNDRMIMQVHLGNGAGRFNQLGDEPLLNPVNEGTGFSIGQAAEHLHAADMDLDGYPDLVMALPQGRIGYIRNNTPDVGQFDMEAPRALLTAMGKSKAAVSGILAALAVGDLDADGAAEIVGITKPITGLTAPWIVDYHPIAQTYRGMLTDPIKGSSSTGKGYFTYVWDVGTYNASLPSWPAAFDYVKPGIESGVVLHGFVEPVQLHIKDFFGPDGEGADGKPDLFFVGSADDSKDGGAVLLKGSAPNNDFWSPTELTATTKSMFSTLNGLMITSEGVNAVDFVNPGCAAEVPTLIVTQKAFKSEGSSMPRAMRLSAWNPTLFLGDLPAPFWEVPIFGSTDDALGKEVPSEAVAIKRVALEGEDAGRVTDDPCVAADTLILTNTGTLVQFEWDPTNVGFPYSPPSFFEVGTAPSDMELEDLDGDGKLDLVASVSENVFVAFGKDSGKPFEAPLPIDRVDGVKQPDPRAIAITDLNDDGMLDVAFASRARGAVMIYLNIGLDESDEGQTRQFHGPLTIDVCDRTVDVVAYDFDGDGCDTLVALCQGAGAIPLLENRTCQINPGN